MKTTRILGFVALVITFFMLTSASPVKAPCPYAIQNATHCKVQLNLDLYNRDCSFCTTIAGITIPPGGSYSIPCGLCSGPFCNIQVTVTMVDVQPVNVIADFNNAGQFPANPCGANTIQYDASTNVFLIQP